MGKSNVAEKTTNGTAEVVEVQVVEEVVNAAAPVMTVVKSETEPEPRRLTLDEKIQRVEDLTMLIEKWRTLSESRRKLQTFNIGADSMSSTIMLRDAAGNEFKTSNSAVITAVIEEMKRSLDTKLREVESQISF